MDRHLYLQIRGIVQGVGFRPFVLNTAREYGVKGYVLNDTAGVTVEARGPEKLLEAFKDRILSGIPPLAVVHGADFTISDDLKDFADFTIRRSGNNGLTGALIPPDVAICPDCLSELFTPTDPRYGYPFINCTNCGPRFTITRELPYDRTNTTMDRFPLCPFCKSQYEDPINRRFHAQPVACPICGPALILCDSRGNPVEIEPGDIIAKASELLKEGKILAVKGLGGFHLACDAANPDAVRVLRQRKSREEKPFALMAFDRETAGRYCEISPKEAELLESPRAPVLLLRKKPGCSIPEEVAPGNHRLGFMLAYTPLHRLLLKSFNGILIMTSGNAPSEPIIYDDSEAFSKLGSVADFFLSHNRPIHVSIDDSVVIMPQGHEYIIRRARGYAPHPLSLKYKTARPVFAAGGHQKNTFCLFRDELAFVSHHQGDLEGVRSMEAYVASISHYQRLFNINPKIAACDMHRGYLSTRRVMEMGFEEIVPVQHHHAHGVSLMAEWGLDGKAIGIIFDGSGFGDDGNLWGCEFLWMDFSGYKRLIHLGYIPLPGGEAAVMEPSRTALSYLYRTYGRELFNLPIPFVRGLNQNDAEFLLKMIDRSINCPLAGSAGRLFDGISALLGICGRCGYEGQAAIMLENSATEEEVSRYEFCFNNENGLLSIDASGVIRGAVRDLVRGVAIGVIAGRFHNTVAEIALKGAETCRDQTGETRVLLSGGVFQNMLLLAKCRNLLEKAGFKVYIHRHVPANDGGISLGQAVAAAGRLGILQ